MNKLNIREKIFGYFCDFSVSYCDFKIEDIEKFPYIDWDFSRMHESRFFQKEWVEKYPHEDWNFPQMSVSNFYTITESIYFDFSWIERYPNLNWNFEPIRRNFYEFLINNPFYQKISH